MNLSVVLGVVIIAAVMASVLKQYRLEYSLFVVLIAGVLVVVFILLWYNMKNNIGILKEIDGLGRLVIPKEMRELFNFRNTVELLITEEGVLVRNPEYVLVKKSDSTT